MSRINSNVVSLIAQRSLSTNNANLGKSLERLSTGFKINRGSDGPAGLIASEQLRSERVAIGAAIGNAERADQVANIMEGGLQEINSLLLEVQNLVGQNASDSGLSSAEKEANQLQVDQIIQTIDRIASTTSFNGVKLLNGSQSFTVSAVDANVTDYQVNGAKIPTGGSVAVNLLVTQSAQHGGLFLNMTAASVNTGGDSATERFTIELAGSKGAREFSFASGTTNAVVAASINAFKDVTGVSAVSSGNFVELKSTGFGSSQFVSVQAKSVTAGQVGTLDTMNTTNEALAVAGTAFTAQTAPTKDSGQDVGGVINGKTARGNGTTLSVASDALDMSITLNTAAGGAQTRGATTPALNITGGGAGFNIGPQIDLNNKVRIGIGNIASRSLGSNTNGFVDDLGSGGSLNLISGNLTTAQTVVNEAITQVASLRGRLGAFQSNVVGATIRALGVALENTTAAESVIRDTDFAQETATLSRNQILVQAASNSLQIANSQSGNVLALF